MLTTWMCPWWAVWPSQRQRRTRTPWRQGWASRALGALRWSCRESLQTLRALVSRREMQWSLPWCKAPVLKAQPHQAASHPGEQELITPRASPLNALNVWSAEQLFTKADPAWTRCFGVCVFILSSGNLAPARWVEALLRWLGAGDSCRLIGVRYPC